MRQGQLLGYFGIFFGAFAIIGLLLVVPTIICAPLGIVCGVRALRRKQRVVGGFAIGLCALAMVGLLLVVFLSANPWNIAPPGI